MTMKVSKLFKVNGLALSIGAIGLSLCGAPFSNAQVCTTPQTAVVYDSTDGVDPDFASPPWSMDCIAPIDGTDFASFPVANGKLLIDDNDDNAKAKYCRADLFETIPGTCAAPGQDAVFEFSCQALEVNKNATSWINSGARFVFSCGFSTGTSTTYDYDLNIAITLNEGVGFFEVDGNNDAHWLSVGGVDQHVNITQVGGSATAWTQPHTFRIVKDGLFVKMYVDNRSTPSLSFRLTYLTDNFLEDEMKILTTSAPGESMFDFMHFRYAIATTSFTTLSTNACAGDTDDDNDVDTDDLIALLTAWGPCVGCAEDLNGDDEVNLTDLIILFSTWGACP